MNIPVLEFFIENVKDEEVFGKRVLEVGSKYVNGSVRPFIERLRPREYIAIDISAGKYVDVVLPAEKVVDYFGAESFDVVISTELLEHIRDWRAAVTNMKRALKSGGLMYITTRSYGFPYHAYPHDFWRYEPGDIQRIFADFENLTVVRDRMMPGVFLKALKPKNRGEIDLSDIDLYSIVLGKKTALIPELKDAPLLRRMKLRTLKPDSRLDKMRRIFLLLRDLVSADH